MISKFKITSYVITFDEIGTCNFASCENMNTDIYGTCKGKIRPEINSTDNFRSKFR